MVGADLSQVSSFRHVTGGTMQKYPPLHPTKVEAIQKNKNKKIKTTTKKNLVCDLTAREKFRF